MKSYIFILLISIFWVNMASARSNSDSIKFFISPDTLHGNENYDEINLTIVNVSTDTIVIINEFRLEGLDKTLIYPINDFSTNLIFAQSNTHHVIEGDGDYPMDYKKFPQFIVVFPNERKLIKLDMSFIKDKLDLLTWELWGLIQVARKNELDVLVNFFYPERKEEYNKSFLFGKSICGRFLDNPLFNSSSNENVNHIKDAFKLRVTSSH